MPCDDYEQGMQSYATRHLKMQVCGLVREIARPLYFLWPNRWLHFSLSYELNKQTRGPCAKMIGGGIWCGLGPHWHFTWRITIAKIKPEITKDKSGLMPFIYCTQMRARMPLCQETVRMYSTSALQSHIPYLANGMRSATGGTCWYTATPQVTYEMLNVGHIWVTAK